MEGVAAQIMGPELLNNPAVVSSGIGGFIAVMLIVVLWRMLIRLDDSLHEISKSQHEDNLEQVRALDRVGGKLDMVLDRTSRTFEQVAIHRGVAEGGIMGQPPAIITPAKE